ncbi:efflux RND transporter periplasmic adaptor subunit [Rhizobium sp. TH2]|uniref:efflux RND transporter periplasmic adaptor subunit n=1 Tax=Rhizobium sp. TH2 TaxID=2775403 RepID=UPI0021577EB4|nr:efflux RND transporter periplasmic adaptor subunit [Rhizobium sp. TH2]UVC06844.1 efflux RND transporter periplasmic adaptor subunit [Rhizobium sp. TH2]
MIRTLLVTLSLAVTGGGGYIVGSGKLPFDTAVVASWLADATNTALKPAGTGPVVYYRHPDGKPDYSAVPKETSDGRDFTPVRRSDDVSFDGLGTTKDKAVAEVATPSGRKVLYYRNPMGLPDSSPVPKKDSMGMDYIAVFEGEADDSGAIKVSPGKLQRMGVRSVQASLSPIVRRLRVPGTVTLDERRVRMVAMRTDAFIETVSDVTTGDRVREGQPLFQFFSKDIAAAAAELVTHQESSAKGGALKLRNFGLSEDAVEGIRRSRKVPDRLDFDAPVSGVVLERIAMPGMMAETGQTLFRIADTSRIWVVAEVPESQLGAVADGAKASVTVRSLPGRTFAGTVAVIYPEIRTETRTAKVRVELDNEDGALRANMFADVAIDGGKDQAVVAVPDTAVVDTGERQVVFVDLGDGRFEPRAVKVGLRGRNEVEITEGIKPGDRVVVSGNFLLDAESNLTSALNAMTSDEGKP